MVPPSLSWSVTVRTPLVVWHWGLGVWGGKMKLGVLSSWRRCGGPRDGPCLVQHCPRVVLSKTEKILHGSNLLWCFGGFEVEIEANLNWSWLENILFVFLLERIFCLTFHHGKFQTYAEGEHIELGVLWLRWFLGFCQYCFIAPRFDPFSGVSYLFVLRSN